jgi:hypothetical protein
MDDGSFLVGTLCGIIATAIVAFILNQMLKARKDMGGADNSLDKFPVAKQPKLTPNGIVKSSRNAAYSYVAWMFALIVILIVSCAGITFVMRL